MTEDFLFFGVLLLATVLSIVFTMLWHQPLNNKRYFISLGFSAVLFGSAVLWWFAIASDGFSQVFGAFVYGGAFVVTGIINLFITLTQNKRHN